MSCFVVSDFHVDVLVSWASLRGAPAFIEGMGPRTLAAVLARANRAAYRARYGDPCEEPEPYQHRDASRLSFAQVVKACDCLDYQCSDWSEWQGSTAQRALARIREHAIRLGLPGYDEAAWSLDEGVAA